jgi:hypothetical protein
MTDLRTAPREELIQLIYRLTEEIESLKAQVAELQAQLAEKKAAAAAPFVKPNRKRQPNKKARKQRASGYARPKDTPTQQVLYAYERCPHCQGPLGKPAVAYTRQVLDLPHTPVTITAHVICKRWCARCQQRVAPRVPLDHLAVGQHRIGIGLMSLIATLRERLRLPIGVIQRYLSSCHDLRLSQGEIVAVLHRVAQHGQPAYASIKQRILAAPMVCADETGGREAGRNGYLWNFVTPTHQYLLYRQSRGQGVVTEVLGQEGEGFKGVLVSDFYAAYNCYSGFHQRCWAHLLRDIHELEETFGQDRKVKRWAHGVKRLYQKAKGYPGPEAHLPLGLQEQERIRQEDRYKEKLRQWCLPWVSTEAAMAVLCRRIIKFLPELFTFIRFAGVPATNNLAERTLRHSVVQRKISGGTRSEEGSTTKAILGSLFGTWHLQGLNPLEQCRLLLAGAPCQGV